MERRTQHFRRAGIGVKVALPTIYGKNSVGDHQLTPWNGVYRTVSAQRHIDTAHRSPPQHTTTRGSCERGKGCPTATTASTLKGTLNRANFKSKFVQCLSPTSMISSFTLRRTVDEKRQPHPDTTSAAPDGAW
eukprot:2600593-Pyramimonas_sp.AAC.1